MLMEKNGKYIVFCNTIDNLYDYYDEVEDWFSGIGEVKKYQVHSYKKRKENQKQLDEFNNDSDGLSVLFCVDILNEGVHVDDIDGVILLRKTISPIIYFQQIGRALSFSGRNKKITIFDLVNNFGNHNAIDAVYKEVEEEMKRKIKEEPENAEKYKEVLRKFKILDETREIIQEINSIKQEVTPEKIILSRVSYAVNTLIDEIEKGNVDIFENQKSKKSYLWLSYYAKYINNEQFERLSKLNIILPEVLCMTIEERLQMLEGFDSIYEKEVKQNSIYTTKLIEFIKTEKRKPNIESTDEQERKLAQTYLVCLPSYDQNQKEEFRKIIEENKIKFESFEKVLLDKKIDSTDVEDLITKGKTYIQTKQRLPEYLRTAIETVTLKYTIKRNEELFEILENHENIIKEEKAKFEQERYEEMSSIMEFLEQNSDLTEEKLKEKIKQSKVGILSGRDMGNIRRKFMGIKKDYYKSLINCEESSDVLTFCKKMKKVSLQEIQQGFIAIKNDQKMNETLKLVIKFMVMNNGNKPDINSENEQERVLAQTFEEYIKQGKINENINGIQEDFNSTLYNPSQIIYQVITKNEQDIKTKMVILKCVDFYNKHGYKPLINSPNEDERDLALQYESECIKKLSDEKLSELNRIFNSKKNLRKLCAQYINNKRINKER